MKKRKIKIFKNNLLILMNIKNIKKIIKTLKEDKIIEKKTINYKKKSKNNKIQ